MLPLRGRDDSGRDGPLWLVSMCLALACAACSASGSVESALAPIVDGTSAAGTEDDAVVAVLGGGLCSGTLIGPRLVLTAKHCVVPEGAAGPISARSVTVATGPSVTSLRATARVAEILTTPGPLAISVGPDPVSGATGTDVAFLILSEELPGVAPVAVRRDSPEGLVGTEVLAIGYGTTRTGSVGTRMRVTATMTGLTPYLIEAVEVVCQGDSGGPLFAVLPDGTREVVGVTSFGVFSGIITGGARCPALRDYWNRVDLHLDLLDEARVRSGECVSLGPEECNSLDDDCSGTIDEGCAAVGEACATAADCAFGPLPERFARPGAAEASCSAGVCVLPCDRRDPGASCTSWAHPYDGETTTLSGLYCATSASGGCDGECRVGGPGPGAFGTTCSADADCESLVCAAGRCASACVGDAIGCATGEVCTAAPAECGGCVAAALRPSERGRGEPCTTGAECASGLCGRTLTCSSACITDRQCGDGMRCDEGECALGARSEAGLTCDVDMDCRFGRCGARDGARFCGTTCSDATPCAIVAMTCVAGVCAPPLAVFGEACAGDAECVSGTCEDGLCTVACGLDAACPIRTRCERTSAGSFCRRPPTIGGCSAARARGGNGRALGLTLLVLAALGSSRRRARR